MSQPQPGAVEDWNSMPQWIKDMVLEAVFIAKYVEARHPEIYTEALQENKFLQWQQKINKSKKAPEESK